jgi:hypothetical protein
VREFPIAAGLLKAGDLVRPMQSQLLKAVGLEMKSTELVLMR